jgi:hypothetical protein
MHAAVHCIGASTFSGCLRHDVIVQGSCANSGQNAGSGIMYQRAGVLAQKLRLSAGSTFQQQPYRSI